METKHPLKSKTMESLLAAVLILIMNILGIGEATPGKTYDTMLDMRGRRTEQVKNLALLGACGGAAYGRLKANTHLGRKKKK